MASSVPEIETIAFSITVSDFDRSRRFYGEGLGFKLGPQQTTEFAAGSEDAKDMNLPGGVKLSSCFAWRAQMRLEILSYTQPAPVAGDVKPPNQTGMNALHFATTDVKGLVDRLVSLGGTVVKAWGVQRAIVADPDGVRINFAAVPFAVVRGIFGE